MLTSRMTRMTVRDVRLHWPEAEAALHQGEEVLITRHGRPVARLLPCVPPEPRRRRRFDPTAHLAWLARTWKGKPADPTTDEWLARDRAD
jgi:antitoxin (DNA-binding transcriptional repressor) of toxin-antitoxin stability system